MARAIWLAAQPDFTGGGNPRVGCVVLAADGEVIGEGYHRGAGFDHAEVVALRQAGTRASGGTAIVTLEPCRHTGRTPPCTEALIRAGIARVVFAITDPGEHSSGGADALRAAGIEVVSGVGADEAIVLVRDWLHVQQTGRPWIIMKCAMSLDGRVAESNGKPHAISGVETNRDAHRLRAAVDAIVVGTGTALIDDPQLTVRGAPDGIEAKQPLRIAVGLRDIPQTARMRGPGFHHVRSRDLGLVTSQLIALGCERVLVEGGPTLQQAILQAGLVDEFRWSISPLLIGRGPTSLGSVPVPIPVDTERVTVVGEDVVVTGRPLR